MNGHTATVVALLDKGAEINARDKVSASYETIQANFNELIPDAHGLMPDDVA